MDMERFLHLLWANSTSCHFSFFLNFIPFYILLIYDVFLNKVLQDFDMSLLVCISVNEVEK
jgi:hypothetical protein